MKCNVRLLQKRTMHHPSIKIKSTYGCSDRKVAARAGDVDGGSSRAGKARRKERLAEPPTGDRHGPAQRGDDRIGGFPGGEGARVGGDEGGGSSSRAGHFEAPFAAERREGGTELTSSPNQN